MAIIAVLLFLGFLAVAFVGAAFAKAYPKLFAVVGASMMLAGIASIGFFGYLTFQLIFTHTSTEDRVGWVLYLFLLPIPAYVGVAGHGIFGVAVRTYQGEDVGLADVNPFFRKPLSALKEVDTDLDSE